MHHLKPPNLQTLLSSSIDGAETKIRLLPSTHPMRAPVCRETVNVSATLAI